MKTNTQRSSAKGLMRYLSYDLPDDIPAYGLAQGKMDLRVEKSLERGDSCRTFWFGMNNHWGTHIDCPAHFFKEGMKVADYPADFWHFQRPQLIPVELSPAQLLKSQDMRASIDFETDLLLFSSGWSRKRGESEYSMENPGLDPSLGVWLRQECPSLRCVGMDWISASSFQNREKGRQAHRIFLNPEGEGHPILMIEDMNLSACDENLKEVWVVPLRVSRLDSAPCTVIGVFQ